jgi:phage shock protein C
LLEFLIIPIAFLILLFGYLGVLFSSKPKTHISSTKEPEKKMDGESSRTDAGAGEYKRLYRSGKDRMIAGVLGGLAEYLNVDPTIVRVIFVIFLFASMGFMILAYLIGWILVPRNPSHQW